MKKRKGAALSVHQVARIPDDEVMEILRQEFGEKNTESIVTAFRAWERIRMKLVRYTVHENPKVDE